MAKGMVEISGLDAVINDLNELGVDIGETAVESITESLIAIETQMKSNANSDFQETQVLVESISHRVTFKDGTVWGNVGVYDMSRKTGSEGRGSSGSRGGVKRRYTAPMVATFYEAGIRPHSLAPQSTLAKKGRSSGEHGQDKKPMHGGHAPVMFMTKAFDSLSPQMFVDLKLALDTKLGTK